MLKWLLILGGVGVVMALKGRKALITTISAVEQAAFHALVAMKAPASFQPYADAILRASEKYQLSPFVMLAITYWESNYGQALTNGTGDFGSRQPRRGGPRKPPPTGYVDAQGVAHAGNKNAGGKGWGYGVWQIDWGSHEAFIATGQAEDPEASTDYIAREILKPNRDALMAKGLTGDALIKAMVASYNTGLGNVSNHLYDPDTTTTGGNYGSKVLAKAIEFFDKFKALLGNV